jgi:hypothetical protein
MYHSDYPRQLQARSSPIAKQGVVSGKAIVDHARIAEWQANATQNPPLSDCYPGGALDLNHTMVEGELAFAAKDSSNMYPLQSEGSERAFVSVSGMRWGEYYSYDGAEDGIYFLGVVLEGAVYGDADEQVQHGVSFERVGTNSIVNTGPFDIPAGCAVAWRLPPTHMTPSGAGRPGYRGVNMPTYTPKQKVVPQIVPFDPTDFSTQLASAYAAMDLNPELGRSSNGISELKLQQLLSRYGMDDYDAISDLQEEGLALKFGLLGVVLRGVESLARQGFINFVEDPAGGITAAAAAAGAAALAGTEKLNIFDNAAPTNGTRTIIEDILLSNVGFVGNRATEALDRFYEGAGAAFAANRSEILMDTAEDDEGNYRRLARAVPEILFGGLANAWNRKASRVIGRALGGAPPGGDLDILIGHFKPGGM